MRDGNEVIYVVEIRCLLKGVARSAKIYRILGRDEFKAAVEDVKEGDPAWRGHNISLSNPSDGGEI
jgi:hypothetical protein